MYRSLQNHNQRKRNTQPNYFSSKCDTTLSLKDLAESSLRKAVLLAPKGSTSFPKGSSSPIAFFFASRSSVVFFFVIFVCFSVFTPTLTFDLGSYEVYSGFHFPRHRHTVIQV